MDAARDLAPLRGWWLGEVRNRSEQQLRIMTQQAYRTVALRAEQPTDVERSFDVINAQVPLHRIRLDAATDGASTTLGFKKRLVLLKFQAIGTTQRTATMMVGVTVTPRSSGGSGLLRIALPPRLGLGAVACLAP